MNNNYNNENKVKVNKTDKEFAYYSRVLNKPFDTVAELKEAEGNYYTQLKAKEDKAAMKKADAKKVEDAFKALNQARKEYKEKLAASALAYSEELKKLKTAFENDKGAIQAELASAETAYAAALKEFTEKYEQYHLTLKDGDFETTIEGHSSRGKTKANLNSDLLSVFDLFFGI